MPWFESSSCLREGWRQINTRVVVCAPPEDLPFWKARLESLGVNHVDLHQTHRDALNELHRYDGAVNERNYNEPQDGLDWRMIMLFDTKIEWAPDFSKEDNRMFGGGTWMEHWTSTTEIGDWLSEKVTYKSSDQELVDLLANGFGSTMDWICGLDHVYKSNRHVRKGNL